MKETRVESALRKGVEALGGTCEKFTPNGKVGIPDRLICWPSGHPNADLGPGKPRVPLTEFVETKAPDGKLESWQARDHDRRRAMGYLVSTIWNLEQVETYLRRRGKK